MNAQHVSPMRKLVAYLLVTVLFFISIGIIYVFAVFSKDAVVTGVSDARVAFNGKEAIAFVQEVLHCYKRDCTTRVSFADNVQATIHTDRVAQGDRIRIVYDEENPSHALANTGKRRYVYPLFSIFYGSIMVLFFLYSLFQVVQVKRGKKNEVEFAEEHPFVAMVIFVPFVFVRKIKQLLRIS